MAAEYNVNKLQVTHLRCIRQHKELFSPLSFELHAGQALLVQGPNGCGKSSLLRLLSGLATPAHGEIVWCNHSIHHAISQYWQDIHYLGHTNGIKLGLTVTENLHLTSHLACTNERGHIDTIVQMLQLSAQAHIQARYLSAGQKRRLGLAKLFLFRKPLWILDEPLTALDIATQTLFLTHLETHLQNGGMAVMSTHHSISLPMSQVKTMSLSAC